MKKLLPLFVLLLVLTLFTGCKKTVYSKEFAYLPSYGSTAQLNSSAPAKGKTLATARYTVRNTTSQKVYDKYKSMLKGNGWKITGDTAGTALAATKDAHLAVLLFQPSGKDVIVVISAK